MAPDLWLYAVTIITMETQNMHIAIPACSPSVKNLWTSMDEVLHRGSSSSA